MNPKTAMTIAQLKGAIQMLNNVLTVQHKLYTQLEAQRDQLQAQYDDLKEAE